MEITFFINGKQYNVNSMNVPVETSLNTFIRTNAQLRGTKFMCLEGGCGACIVTARGIHPVTKQEKSWAINSCLVPVFSCHGLDIITIEGVGNKKDGYHQLQTRLTHFNGIQCGYCSPGMVMNMFSLLESKEGKVTMEEIENSFGGNICRCTGYRPILDAFKSLAVDANEKLVNMCKDIEDLNKTCPKTGSPCAGTCHIRNLKKNIHLSFEADKEWHRVYNVNDVFNILERNRNKPYMLVSGNTAHGVYRRNPNIEVFIDVTGIEELRKHSIGKQIIIGANVSLNETMEILEKAASSNSEFQYCREIIKHIDLIANVPVRNIGSLAGNLCIKNQHEEFPSDVYIILETIGAKLTIADERGKVTTVSTIDFLKLDMNNKLILSVILPGLPVKKFVFKSYKIMPRAQNAHAYVNAGFLIEFNEANKTIDSARLCFGGIDPKFTHAMSTEVLLIGKELHCNDTLQAALKCMNREINPNWNLPDASPEFRKHLAMALFYKFVLNTCPDSKLRPELKLGGFLLDRPLSSGTQTYTTLKDKWPLNQAIPKYEGLVQSSGEAQYSNDISHQPGELWAAFVPATKVHGIIKNIDATKALSVPGIKAFFSAKDIPGINNFGTPKLMFLTESEEILCSSKVLFNGQPAGIIVAKTFTLANYGASLVTINYENEVEISATPQIHTNLKDILKTKPKDRLFDQPFNQEQKKVPIDTLQKTFKINGRLEIGGQFHFSMEPQTCVCIPVEDGMDVFAATQWMDLCQVAISHSLNIPENRINLQVRRLGGGFGAKISRATQVACACALACHLTNRPVRFVMTIESNMTVMGKRYPCINDYEAEFDDVGKIQNLTNSYYEDFGCSLNETVSFYTTPFFKNCYNGSNWGIKGVCVKTDSASNTWCRAPGTTEGIAMIEHIMNHIAKVTKQDPVAVRLANIENDNPMKTILSDFAKSVDYDTRKTDINTFNNTSRWRKRGIAVVPMQYHIEYFGHFPVFVSIYHGDGTVAISHGGIEMGQGINTKIIQVAAHILGISIDMISVKPSNTLTAANSILTGGSITSDVVSHAVMNACKILLDRIQIVREEMKEAKWHEIVHACYNKNIDLTTTYLGKHLDLKAYYIYGVSCAEVEVDLLTGNLQLRRVDILEDTGESLNPTIDIGQIEGAFVMGLGYWLTEDLIFNNENGELLTNRTWNYKPPGIKDIPIDFRIKFLQNSSNPTGVLRSKTTGEPALTMAVVAVLALRHALDSARLDAGCNTDWFSLSSPVSPEKIFLSANNNPENFIL